MHTTDETGAATEPGGTGSTTATEPRADGNNTAAVLVSLTALALALGLFTVSTLALFTDQELVGNNTFSTGDVDIATAPTTAVVSASAMMPGDQVTAPLVVSNDGNVELRYSVVSTTTEDVLAAELDLTIKVGVTTCDDANWGADGTVLYTGILGSTGGTAVIGDATAGNQAGDRTLATSASETLCVNVTLPSSASSSVQGLSTTATLTFDAEQTDNNP